MSARWEEPDDACLLDQAGWPLRLLLLVTLVVGVLIAAGALL